MSSFSDEPLKIVHVLRAPLGGLFRHVVDLTREQTARGHHVGLICDSSTGGDRAAGAYLPSRRWWVAQRSPVALSS